MTLYDSILEHERHAAEAMVEVMVKRIPAFRDYILQASEKILPSNNSKLELILKKAQQSKEQPPTGQQIEGILEGIDLIDIQEFGLVLSQPEIIEERKEWVLAVFGYYQRLMAQEGHSLKYEDAARRSFSNRESLRGALQPIMDSEKRLSDLAISNTDNIILQEIIKSQQKATEYIIDLDINYLFPEE